jgi:hypothetical protein
MCRHTKPLTSGAPGASGGKSAHAHKDSRMCVSVPEIVGLEKLQEFRSSERVWLIVGVRDAEAIARCRQCVGERLRSALVVVRERSLHPCWRFIHLVDFHRSAV